MSETRGPVGEAVAAMTATAPATTTPTSADLIQELRDRRLRDTEQLKLWASFFNALATATIGLAIIGPAAFWSFGYVGPFKDKDFGDIGPGLVFWVLVGFALHLAGQSALEGVKQP